MSTAEVAPFVTNYMYPIVHFAAIHPCGLVGLHTDTLANRGGSTHDQMLAKATNTVWGDNDRSKWRPENGFCLAWPSATRITNGSAPGRASALLDRYEAALKTTMQPNFWPDMGGGGLEQAGAAVAVDELLLQSHEGFLALFPAWERGVHAASFTTLRARGAFLVSAAIDAGGTVLPGTVLQSEVGTPCRMVSPWGGGGGGGGGGNGGNGRTPPFTVRVKSILGANESVAVVFGGWVGRGVATWTFNTTANTTYTLHPSS